MTGPEVYKTITQWFENKLMPGFDEMQFRCESLDDNDELRIFFEDMLTQLSTFALLMRCLAVGIENDSAEHR